MPVHSSTIDETLKESVLTHPFGDLKDPNFVKSTNNYFTPLNLINLAIYGTAEEKIFGFESVANVEVDKNLKVWSALKRTNSQGVIPELVSNQVRLGALNSIFGYLSNNTEKYATVVASSDALPYFKTDLRKNQSEFNLNLQVSTLDYYKDSLVSNYATGLSFANDLNLSVFTPLSAAEAQHLSVLASVFSKTQKTTALNLYDGLSYLKQSVKFDQVLDLETNLDLSKKLTAAAAEWSSLPFVERPAAALKALSAIVGTKYAPFEYHGSTSATKVFVIYGSVESELFINEIKSRYVAQSDVGVIAIRSPLPFNVSEFIQVLPESTEQLVIIGQSLNENSSSVLKTQIQAAVFVNGLSAKVKVEEFVYLPNFIWSNAAVQQIVAQFVNLPVSAEEQATAFNSENFIFWSLDNSDVVELSSRVAHTLSLESRLKFEAKFDNLKAGGIYQSQIASAGTVGVIDSADLVYVDDLTLLAGFNVVKTAKKGSVVLVRCDELPKEKADEYVTENFPKAFLKKIASNENKLVVVNLAAAGDISEIQGFQKLITVLVAFWRSAFPELQINDLVRKILVSLGSSVELLPAVLVTIIQEKLLPVSVKEIGTSNKWLESGEAEEEQVLPVFPLEHSFKPSDIRETDELSGGSSNSKVELLKRLTFQQSYVSSSELRPDLAMKNFVVKVKENRRVTPGDYSRNIFHIEFDIAGTGLTYDIGEALGVHARNDTKEVVEFLEWYGLDFERIIEAPNKDDNSLIELRTVYQTFVENLDLLGKPGKSFYESLAEFSTEEKEQIKLKFLASPEGATELKSYQEDEFFSYSDILRLFPSAHPSLNDLIKLIPTLKRREYSISSSQKLHPEEVHLLIVVVEWQDKRQRRRFGQCSKYLSDLAIGSELVVSVKPSVMKLPPLSTQPVIMSGLGTGLAPFKAIIEEKIWQKSQGLPIGEIYLYLGSRHRREEYLYGELWEAYKAEGILTHIGAAFSRDQPEKVYIQDKIRENINELSDLIVKKQGVFYLCGPTWPVPDITAVLEDIVENDAKFRGETIDKVRVVEDMKEDSRYILEVY